MNDSTAQLLKNTLGSLARWILVLISGLLIKKGIISTEQSEVYIQQLTPVLIGVLMSLAALVWSLWQKKHQVEKIEKALEMPSGSTIAQLERKA